jgi:Zn-dependent protease with chaperone function
LGKSKSKSVGTVLLLLLLLAVPLLVFIVARSVEWKLDSTLRSALIQQFPERTDDIHHASVSELCKQPDVRADADLAETCNLSDNMQLLKTGAVVAAILGVALLIAIRIAGTVSKKSRILLLLLFAPGLHITMLATSVLVVLYAALGMAAIYYGEAALIGRIHYGIMLALGLGAIFGVVSVIRAQFSTIKKATITVLGKRLTAEKYPRLWQFAHELATKMGAQSPDAIVAGLEPNFYVTEANVICLDGKLTGRTMFLSLPLCRILSLDEMKAILGHELAHYKGLDTRFSRQFYPIYRGATQGLIDVSSGFSGNGGAAQVALLPALVTLSYFLDSFSVSEKAISRGRELVADSEAAKIVTARNLATSLVKLHSFSDSWSVIRKEMQHALGQGKQLINISMLFALVARQRASSEVMDSVSEEGPVHPTDTHPPLSQRLKNLNLTIEEVGCDSAELSPSNPATNLVDNLEGLEEELTDVEHAMMVRTGKVQVASPDI